MRIHTVRADEKLSDIAARYGTDEESVAGYNGIKGDRVCVGEQLLLLIPTRTYTPRAVESTESVALRFGVKAEELRRNNPCALEGVTPKHMTVKYSPHPYGSAAANGYLYRGYDRQRLKEVLPFLTYLTVVGAELKDDGIRGLFDTAEALSRAREARAVRIAKLVDKRTDKKSFDTATERIIEFAKRDGYDGVALEINANEGDIDEIAAFLVRLRGAMIGNDLILITELHGEGAYQLADYADGCVFPTDEGEDIGLLRERLRRFAEDSESIKTFVELPSFASSPEGYLPIDEAVGRLRAEMARANTDAKTLLTEFECKGTGRIVYPSLSYIKAVLDDVNEYGYMGISFDATRMPLQFLHAYASLFKPLKGLGNH